MIRHWKTSAAIALVMLASSCGGAYQETYVRASYRSSTPGAAVSMSYFYDEMAPYGRWIDYQPYGWCWTPYDASPGWRPYSDGYWVYTEFGWTWASSEPWGWAAYHYGRWTFDGDYGWVWVPGNTWGPAWVAWTYGDEWVGWAPLGPGVDISIRIADYDRIPDQQWCFVERQHFADSNLRPWVVSSARNRTLLSRTRALARVDENSSRDLTRGPDVSLAEKWTGRKIAPRKIVDAESPSRGQGRSMGGNAVGFFRPPIREKDAREAPPPSVEQREVTIPTPVLRRQQIEEQRKLEASLAEERSRLDREQARELRFQPPGTKLDEIRAKHAAEKQAFEGHAAEQRAVLEKRLEKKIVKPERAKNAKPDRDKDNEKKKGDRGEG